ncbi:hypothetical protein BD413DRAFT_499911 [Trametes elegans]|nr:hypothetical protein BD413DRAFT_499911 [Trametes elegans]
MTSVRGEYAGSAACFLWDTQPGTCAPGCGAAGEGSAQGPREKAPLFACPGFGLSPAAVGASAGAGEHRLGPFPLPASCIGTSAHGGAAHGGNGIFTGPRNASLTRRRPPGACAAAPDLRDTQSRGQPGRSRASRWNRTHKALQEIRHQSHSSLPPHASQSWSRIDR